MLKKLEMFLEEYYKECAHKYSDRDGIYGSISGERDRRMVMKNVWQKIEQFLEEYYDRRA